VAQTDLSLRGGTSTACWQASGPQVRETAWCDHVGRPGLGWRCFASYQCEWGTEATLGGGIFGLALAVDLGTQHESKYRPSDLVPPLKITSLCPFKLSCMSAPGRASVKPARELVQAKAARCPCRTRCNSRPAIRTITSRLADVLSSAR
jgi:hypothetical protein